MNNRQWLHRGVLLVCGSIVALTSLVTPEVGTGRCGTAHYFLFQLLGYLTLSKFAPNQSSQLIERSVPIVLNVVVFFIPASILYLKAPRAWFIRGLIAWTIVYLVSYFFLFPMPGCP